MDGIRNINNEIPNGEESVQFWSNIWDNEKEHERNAEWLRELRAKKDNMKQNNISQHNNWDDKKTSQKDPELEEPRTRRSLGILVKILTDLHEHIAKQMDNIIIKREDIPK